MCHTACLATVVIALAMILACTTEAPANTPTPLTIEVGPFEPTLDISNCSTTICCSNCPDIPVHRIIDGDTFISANATIRLFVDTPERGEPCYAEARERFTELAGDSVRVEHEPRQGDQFGRILYYVYTMEGESIDEMLAREGLALAWLEDGQHLSELLAAEARAKEAGRGCLGGGSEPPIPAGDCDPSYPDVCIPSPPPDLACGDIAMKNIRVVGSDPHRFDGNNDSVGCES